MDNHHKTDVVLRILATVFLLTGAVAGCLNLSRPVRLVPLLLGLALICANGVLQYVWRWRAERSAANKWKLILFAGFSVVMLCLVVGAYFWLA